MYVKVERFNPNHHILSQIFSHKDEKNLKTNDVSQKNLFNKLKWELYYVTIFSLYT
jgi:hypothetical protein